MFGLRRFAWIVLGVLLGYLGPTEAAGDISRSAEAPTRQILVMIREHPIRHYFPGAGYAGAYEPDRESPGVRDIAASLARIHHFRLISHWPMPSLGVRCFLAEVDQGQESTATVARLASDPRVESAQVVQLFHMLGHQDAYYGLQTSAARLHYDQLHKLATGRNVRIAQIDTGVEVAHPDLQGQTTAPINLVDDVPYAAEAHGTEVAGIMVAKADNVVGIVGIAPGAKLVPLRGCWEDRSDGHTAVLCTSFTLAKAMQTALSSQVRVINLSLAGPPDQLLERLIDKAVAGGAVVVAAVDPQQPTNSFPASLPQVVAVVTDGAGGAGSAISAPGERVLTTTPGGSWGFVSGSSFAAAHVSGLAALLIELSPAMTSAGFRSILRQYGQPVSGRGESMINACAMLAHVAGDPGCDCCGTLASPARPPQQTERRPS